MPGLIDGGTRVSAWMSHRLRMSLTALQVLPLLLTRAMTMACAQAVIRSSADDGRLLMSCGAGSKTLVKRPAPRLLSLSSGQFYSPGAVFTQQGMEVQGRSSSILGCTSRR
jgi:hypothetical protein